MKTRGHASPQSLLAALLIASLLAACADRSAPAEVPVSLGGPLIAAPTAVSTMVATTEPMVATSPVASPTAAAQVTPTPGTPPSAPVHFPTPDAQSLPKDKAGRVLGGNQPIINYAPDMVTGKPCPRVTQWQPRALTQVSGPAGDFFVASDPCVVQNAIDDFVQIAWAIPWYNDREQMLELEKLYLTDPVLKRGIDPEYFKRGLEGKKYQDVWRSYRVCSPPLHSLIVASTQSKMDRTGRVIELGVVDVTMDLSSTSCQTTRFDTGGVIWRGQLLGDSDKAKGLPVFAYWMFWSDSERRWQFGGLANPFGKLTLKQVQELHRTRVVAP